jgi:hypothetical protein
MASQSSNAPFAALPETSIMSRSFIAHLGCVLGLAALAGFALAAAPPRSSFATGYRLSGPYTHDNLTIFLLHGKDQIEGKKILTLDEALAGKKVIVHETKDVNKLTIENLSGQEVFVQAGDVVKGGQQDRALAVDMMVPPKSGKVPIPAFCVEQGRWSKRDMEDEKSFNSSKDRLVGKRLNLAARSARSQGQVWRSVDYEQMRLSKQLDSDLKDSKSVTSYQLTLENKKLIDVIAAYVKKLEKSPDKQKDVIGCVVVINGKVHSADAYANADLFRKLWPKLLKCAAVEAVTEKDAKLKFEAARTADVAVFLAEPEKAKETHKDVTKVLREYQKETDRSVLFETRSGKVVLRRNYLAK